MKAVIQRVSEASVLIDNICHAEISAGIVVFLGIKKGDDENLSRLLARKTVDLRIFQDNNEKMNLCVNDVNGEILVISQFTLCTDNDKSGNRPSFTLAEEPYKAKLLYEVYLDELKKYYAKEKVFSGVFAAMMKVSLVNDGPVTIIIERNN